VIERTARVERGSFGHVCPLQELLSTRVAILTHGPAGCQDAAGGRWRYSVRSPVPSPSGFLAGAVFLGSRWDRASTRSRYASSARALTSAPRGSSRASTPRG
jgi:hypothetical protein